MDDLIRRQAAIDAIREDMYADKDYMSAMICDGIEDVLSTLPSAQPEIIRCADCRWWDRYDNGVKGYCIAAKHGFFSEHWEIGIYRTYKGDFYCADAERRTDDEG